MSSRSSHVGKPRHGSKRRLAGSAEGCDTHSHPPPRGRLASRAGAPAATCWSAECRPLRQTQRTSHYCNGERLPTASEETIRARENGRGPLASQSGSNPKVVTLLQQKNILACLRLRSSRPCDAPAVHSFTRGGKQFHGRRRSTVPLAWMASAEAALVPSHQGRRRRRRRWRRRRRRRRRFLTTAAIPAAFAHCKHISSVQREEGQKEPDADATHRRVCHKSRFCSKSTTSVPKSSTRTGGGGGGGGGSTHFAVNTVIQQQQCHKNNKKKNREQAETTLTRSGQPTEAGILEKRKGPQPSP